MTAKTQRQIWWDLCAIAVLRATCEANFERRWLCLHNHPLLPGQRFELWRPESIELPVPVAAHQ